MVGDAYDTGTGLLQTQVKVKLTVKDEKHGNFLLIGASDIEDNTNIFSVDCRVSKGVDVCRHLRYLSSRQPALAQISLQPCNVI